MTYHHHHLAETHVEIAALKWFRELGYEVRFGGEIAPGEPAAERESYREVILAGRLRGALSRLNPELPAEAREEAFRRVTRLAAPSLELTNQAFHRLLVEGVPVEYRAGDRVVHDLARLADFQDPAGNDWLAVNQFTVEESHHNRRPDIVVFLNGLPVAVFELKNPVQEKATIWSAWHQVQTYKKQIPSLFACNEIIAVSDGISARFGSLTAGKDRFQRWRTIEGQELAPAGLSQLEVLLRGLFARGRLLLYLRHYIVFEEEKDGTLSKKIAGYHQFHAVEVALQSTLRACGAETGAPAEAAPLARVAQWQRPYRADRRCGVIWHTQGSGKSLTMVFYAGRLVVEPALANPTVVVVSDRNDLDNQLFGTFSRCRGLLRQQPAQAENRAHLRELLAVASGGVVFTTIQKFFPESKGDSRPTLSERSNIVVIADEAHRSQYDFIDGFAAHLRDALPGASFIGFTGTPLELADRNTRAVFGDYISVYDILRAVEDQATVPIYYEGRMARLALDEAEKPHLDEDFEELTEDEEETEKEQLKRRWAALEALAGAERRVSLIAGDLLEHFEKRQEALAGKAMVVCMSRRICVAMYDAIVARRPGWHDRDDLKGRVKVVMTGSAADPLEWQAHLRSKEARGQIEKRFRDPGDPLQLVIVRDMWLTGFDVPCLHTMYVDKPMKGHGLMQAIARVNRVFRDKPGGLVVDYIGLGYQLRQALRTYTESGGAGEAAIDQAVAVAVLEEKYEICLDLFHGFDWSAWPRLSSEAQWSTILPAAQEHILAQENGKERLLRAVTELSQAFALAVPHPRTKEIRSDVDFFQSVRACLIKRAAQDRERDAEEMEQAIQQLVSKAISSDEVVDIFASAGLRKPDISILSEEFLAEVRELPHRNLAVEVLERLIRGELRNRSRKFLVQSRSFLEMLEKSLLAYRNRSVETAQVIEELIQLAREMQAAARRGEEMNLSEAELAFYDALETSDSAVAVLGDETLRQIARELVETLRRNVTIDWTIKESVRANLRRLVRRILRRYNYPPDKQEQATRTVLEQAEELCADWVA